MSARARLSRIRGFYPLLPLLVWLSACGSTATSVTSPSTINRCAITVRAIDAQIPAQGGSGSITVGAARDCTWTATVEGQWLSIRVGANGQGDGTVEFAAAPNPDPSTRRGAVVLNGQRAEITQAPASCSFSLGESSASFGQAGGTGSVPVRASSALCAWTASADASWITLRTDRGTGTGALAFDVVPTTGPPRSGTITVADQKFSVTQAEGCAYTIAPATFSAQPAGGSGAISITAPAACTWTASSNVEWLSVGPPSGAGPGAVTFTVAPTSGPARVGTAVVAGQTFTVTQSPGCSYSVSPLTPSVGADGGAVTITVSAGNACPWTSTSNVSWIVPQGASSGTGNGSMTWLVASTSGPSRTGTVTVAGQLVTFTQSPGCAFTIAPESASHPASGGTGRVAVTTTAGCAWTASSSASWLTITAGASGSGNGEVQYSAAATTGPGRSATMTIAGRTFTVSQGQGCTYALSPTSANIGDNGGPGSFTVQTSAGCGWTAASSVPWITITPPADGTGEGQVRFTVADNNGPSRSAAITAGGQTFTVQQGNGCSYSISPSNQSVAAGGATGTVNVSSGSGCGWTATSNASWLSITSGASGTGNAPVRFTAAANTGPGRTGTLTIAGRTFTVTQAEGCTFAIAPDSASPGAAGGTFSVNVTTAGGCGWNASSTVPWMRVTSASSGTGNGTVQLTVDPNSGASRTGTATIAGRTFTVNQGAGCTYSVNPTSQGTPAGATTVTVDVTSGAGCGWTAASNVPWMTIASGGSGTGSGQVRIDVQANTDAARSGTATIAGQTFTLNQDSGCSYTVAPETIGSPATGGATQVNVTTAGSCGWTATSGAGWISVTSGSPGTGSGTVGLSVAANSGPARSGTVAVAGRTVTVNQDSGCTYALSAASQNVPAAGGGGSVNVTAAAGCAWTAASNAPWIIITAGANGSGDGTVTFTVDPNATGAPRSGTLTIAGQTFTVNQE